ncbi:MAG: cytochrome-c peroxidase [Planctomycetaceae bacterium]|nr:cytochrome-c peroxidase [Planctomycetaceae bacterium]
MSPVFAQKKIAGKADRATGKHEGPWLVPLPSAVTAPPDNPTSRVKALLGKQLFFDPRLSGDNTISCASCHIPRKAYADGIALARGQQDQLLTRNTQSCLNVGFYSILFWDGRAASLEQQALIPIQSAREMNQDLAVLEQELANVPGYVRQFEEVFGCAPNRDGIAKALSAYQRTLVTGPSAYDRFLMGDEEALSKEAKQGLELFQGDAGCIECHHGPLLSDNKFYRLRLRGDLGRALVTGDDDDRYRFRTPSLRNVAETGPYMHDGSLQTLDEVVTFYYREIPSSRRNGLLPDTQALTGQSFSEIPLLVAFLKSLTGTVPEFIPPQLPVGRQDLLDEETFVGP